MDEHKYEMMGIEVTCIDGIEYIPGLFGLPQVISVCTGKGIPERKEG